MAFSSILSSTESDPPVRSSRSLPASKHFKTSAHTNGDTKSSPATLRKSATKAAASPKDYPGQTKRPVKSEIEPLVTTKSIGHSKPALGITSDKENEKVKKEMAKIDAMDMSDLELPEFEAAKQRHVESSLKRQQAVEEREESKRKVRP